jgi:penicillin-binding protein 2
VSLALRAKHQNNQDFAQNGWFVGFTPRRNPDIIVCVLFEGGEHGKLAARLATQVIKAYVDKQQRQPTKMASKNGKVEMSALWTDPGAAEDAAARDAAEGEPGSRLQGGRFVVDVGRKKAPLAMVAPGLH